MKRVHLFEFEDLPWFPAFLRNYMTDFLQFIAHRFDIYKPVVPLLKKGIAASETNSIIDLASGGGGGLMQLCEHLRKDHPHLKITLTDYYPHLSAFQQMAAQSNCFDYIESSVNAMDVPEHLKGLRTLFLSFHHFDPDAAGRILQNAVDAHMPIGIFEAQERSFSSLLAMFFSPVTVWLVTPMIKPFTLGRFLFTYLIPLVPLFAWWDGIVSALRTYAVREMEALVSQLENKEAFTWEIGKIKSGPGKVLYLLGYPKAT